jgi:hypothetical protein
VIESESHFGLSIKYATTRQTEEKKEGKSLMQKISKQKTSLMHAVGQEKMKSTQFCVIEGKDTYLGQF